MGIDGIGLHCAGNLFLDLPSFLPSTAAAVMEILERRRRAAHQYYAAQAMRASGVATGRREERGENRCFTMTRIANEFLPCCPYHGYFSPSVLDNSIHNKKIAKH